MAPKKAQEKKVFSNLGKVARNLFPPSTPPAAPRKEKRETAAPWSNQPPIFISWHEHDFCEEIDRLVDTGEVREQFLLHRPEYIMGETSREFLEKMAMLYFPASQPFTEEEAEYLKILRDCVAKRLSEL